MTSFQVQRMGVLMEPDPNDPREVEGVLNPAVIRGKDGHLYIFPRIVGKGNYSRIGIGRVVFNDAGDPVGVERLGIALEPEADYETGVDGHGGCEDPRVSYVEARGHYVMTYSALTIHGPRIAVAHSDDLIHWTRVGLARFHAYKHISFSLVDDKDAAVFPEVIKDPDHVPSIAMLHRPMFDNAELGERTDPKLIADELAQESIWVSYWHTGPDMLKPARRQFVAHRRLARSEAPWENAKIGIGAPPVRCRHGWLLVYHGVEKTEPTEPGARGLIYRAGVMVLAPDDIHRILYRAEHPILSPESEAELRGAVDAVVFPSGLDQRDDIGQPDRYDLYYGMADSRIGVARLFVPEHLPGAG